MLSLKKKKESHTSLNSQGTNIKRPLTIQTLTASKTELRPHIGSANCMWGSTEVAIVKAYECAVIKT